MGKKTTPEVEGLAALDLREKMLERCDVDAAQAEALSGEVENRTPKFFARVRQGRDDERAGTEGDSSFGFLIKASAGHD